MANPPITIGPFANVPAPGSPIRSDWCQDVSTYIANNVLRKDIATAQSVASPTTFSSTVVASSLTAATGNIQANTGGVNTPSGSVTAGGADPSSQPSSRIRQDGAINSYCADSGGTGVNSASINLARGGAVTGGTGGLFIRFSRGSADNTGNSAEIGSIKVATGNSSVVYNTSSDPRLKNNLGPISDAAERIQALAANAFSGTWKAAPDGDPEDMLSSNDVELVAPYAVTGVRDAVAPAPPLVDDDEGNPVPDPGFPPEGAIVAQQVDYSRLVPLLTAALGDALARIEALERHGPQV